MTKEAQIAVQLIDIFKSNNDLNSVDDLLSVLNSLGMPFEETMPIIFLMLKAFLGGGRSATFDGSYDIEELKLGMQIEQEHVDGIENKVILNLIAMKITMDHLAEDPKYYSKLATLGL